MFNTIRIMIAALSFLLDYEKIEDDSDSDASSSDDELSHQSPHVTLSKEAAYKVSRFWKILYDHIVHSSTKNLILHTYVRA